MRIRDAFMERAELMLAPLTVPFCLGVAYVMGAAGQYPFAAPFAVLGILNTVLPPIVAKRIADDTNAMEKNWKAAQARASAPPRVPELPTLPRFP